MPGGHPHASSRVIKFIGIIRPGPSGLFKLARMTSCVCARLIPLPITNFISMPNFICRRANGFARRIKSGKSRDAYVCILAKSNAISSRFVVDTKPYSIKRKRSPGRRWATALWVAVVAAHSPAGHAAVVAALHYFRAATGEGAAFEGLVQAVGDATAATALRRDVLLFVNTLVNAAPDLADRAELRAQLHSAGLGRALAGVAAAVGGGGADADAAAAEELEAQLRVYEAVAADDAQRVAAAAGAAGEALRLDDEAALLKAWTARATRRGAGKEARALARYLACLPLDDARGPCAAINMARHPRAVAAPPPAGIRAGAVATRSRR